MKHVMALFCKNIMKLVDVTIILLVFITYAYRNIYCEDIYCMPELHMNLDCLDRSDEK